MAMGGHPHTSVPPGKGCLSLTGPSAQGEQSREPHNAPCFLDSSVPHSLLTPEVLLDGQGSLSFSEEFFSLEPATDVLLYHNTTPPELIQSELL